MVHQSVINGWRRLSTTSIIRDKTRDCISHIQVYPFRAVIVVWPCYSSHWSYHSLSHNGVRNRWPCRVHEPVERWRGHDTSILGVAAGLSKFCSPFERILKVLHYKLVVFIPIPMVATGALNNIMWIVYCPMVGRCFVFGSNLTCLILCSANIVL